MDSDAAGRLVDALSGWPREVGWRVDGWAALAALGLLWRPPGTTLYAEGPSHLGAAPLDVARERLHLIVGIRVIPLRARAGSQSRRTVELAGSGGWRQRLFLAPSARPRPGVQTDLPHLLRIPPLDGLLARRNHLLATIDVDDPRHQDVAIDACALATIVAARDHHRPAERLAPAAMAWGSHHRPARPPQARRRRLARPGRRRPRAPVAAVLVAMIRHRLDPDAMYPARLAGTHAWAAWGLTDHADPHRLELAIPARYPDSYVHDLVGRIADSLAQPLWPDTDPPPIDVHGRTVRSLDDSEPVTIEILDLAWYQQRSERRPAGEAVTLDHWPIIDETAATRQRLEAITTHGVTGHDVTDIARWTQLKTAQTDAHPTAPTRIGDLFTQLRRDAPAAIDGINSVIDHARTTYQRHGDPDSIREAFQTLITELARLPGRRDRIEMARR